ncbi:MAG TPA: site-specific integrase [Paludibacter sp.]|nr:site-specific integrase [Paludibacter sp.]
MPKIKRYKTNYPGVFYIETKNLKGKERTYYIRYRRKGNLIEEKAGRQYQDDMSPAKAAKIRGIRIDGEDLSNNEKRKRLKAEKIAEAGKMTFARLWKEYETNKPDSKAIKTDKGRFEKYLLPIFENKEPHEIIPLEVDRLRVTLLKTLKPQSVKHVLALLKRIVNFGISRQLCQNINFKIEMIKVDNKITEDLNHEQLQKLLIAIDNSEDIEAANIMKLALFTGMRRGEIFKLKWDDIDFDRRFITIRNPKGGASEKIPLNDQAQQVLENHPRTSDNVFVRSDGKPFTDIRRRVNPIKQAAGLPDNFRALHGLRHTFASILASSGKVDLYTLQKLLTHKSPVMTQRYAHLRDDALKKAADIAGKLIIAA